MNGQLYLDTDQLVEYHTQFQYVVELHGMLYRPYYLYLHVSPYLNKLWYTLARRYNGLDDGLVTHTHLFQFLLLESRE